MTTNEQRDDDDNDDNEYDNADNDDNDDDDDEIRCRSKAVRRALAAGLIYSVIDESIEGNLGKKNCVAESERGGRINENKNK